MTKRSIRVSGWLSIGLALALVTSVSAQQPDRAIPREHRLPCNGVVSLFYGDELIWRKGGGEIRAIKDLVEVPDLKQPGMTGIKLSSLLALRPNVAAIELESCKPRLRRFERAEIESDKGDGLYLIATNYRGFKLRNVSGHQRGGGMKNIGKVVLVPATGDASAEPEPDKKTGGGRGSGKGSGRGSARDSGKDPGQNSPAQGS